MYLAAHTLVNTADDHGQHTIEGMTYEVLIISSLSLQLIEFTFPAMIVTSLCVHKQVPPAWLQCTIDCC